MTQQNHPTAPRPLIDAEKDILIAKMLECPGQLSDSDVTRILEDDELRDIYNISVNLKAGKKSQIPLDAKEEWKLFEPLMDKPQSPIEQEDNTDNSSESSPNRNNRTFAWFNLSRSTIIKRITRVAAIFVGAFLVVGAIQVMNHNSTERNKKELIARNNPSTQTPLENIPQNNSASQLEQEDPTLLLQPNTNEVGRQLEAEEKATPSQESSAASTTPIKTKKKKPGAQVNSNYSTQPQIAQVTDEVDIEAHLRIQRARMENDLAMQRAEAVINQYYTMAEMTGEDPNPLAANLNYAVPDMDSNELVALILP